jgi:hypothetical protein
VNGRQGATGIHFLGSIRLRRGDESPRTRYPVVGERCAGCRMRRRDVYSQALIDGREARQSIRQAHSGCPPSSAGRRRTLTQFGAGAQIALAKNNSGASLARVWEPES